MALALLSVSFPKNECPLCCAYGLNSDVEQGPKSANALALQLRFWEMSESMGNHDSEVVDAGSVD